MVLIKLSASHKIVGIGTAILLAAIVLISATRVVSNDVDYAKNETTSKTETSVTKSYESDTQDKCLETTVITTPASTTTSETKEMAEETEVVKETTSVVVETTTDTVKESVDENLYIQYYTDQDAIDIAKVLYRECRGVPSTTEQACVAWTILNRVDSYGSTIYSVIRSPYQFAFYENTPIWDELLDLAYDVLDRWSREKSGETYVGRVLPKEYIYFEGRDGHNHFRDNYRDSYNLWDYSLESPYES